MDEKLLKIDPYSLSQKDKEIFFLNEMLELTKFHSLHCREYPKILSALFPDFFGKAKYTLAEIPYLPVRLFKTHALKSISESDVFKILKSSGTTDQSVSQVFLDRDTAALQTKTLACIMQSWIGPKRRPMIIVDSPSVLKSRAMFSARGAGILGMMNFGRDHFYLLKDDLTIDHEGLKNFLDRNNGQPTLIFGFTFMVWQHLYHDLKHLKLDLADAVLVHSGGWKKMSSLRVDNKIFKQELASRLGITSIHNFYGMVEQVGSIYVECSEGYLHTPIFSDILIRDSLNFELLPHGRKGIIETLSLLPRSYPGHALLTEDEGTIFGEDNCNCGLRGKYFLIHGRLPRSELRGRSDTYAENLSGAA